MSVKSVELALECKRQSESCLYTSTSFFIWLSVLRWLRAGFVTVPFVLGSLATWNLLTGSSLESIKVFTAICAFLAGILPGIYAALKLDRSLELYRELAGEFKNLQDRFRQAALVSSGKPFAEFEADVMPLMDRLERARSHSLTPPWPIFQLAQRKVKQGDYDFDVDLKDVEKQAAEQEQKAGPPQAGS